MQTTTLARFSLIATFAVSTALFSGCVDEPTEDTENLSSAEQFDAVINRYPEVAKYIIESDAVLDVYADTSLIVPLDTQLYPHGHLGLAASERLRESVLLDECLNAGLNGCYELACSVEEAADCDLNCENEMDDARRAVCAFREEQCRATSRVTCHFIPAFP